MRKLLSVMSGSYLLAACLACGCADPYGPNGRSPRLLSGQVSPHAIWKAVEITTLTDAKNAFDDDLGTAAVGRRLGNDAITIDLGKVCMFNLITIHHGNNGAGTSRRIAVLTSLDGVDYEHRTSGPGKRRVTNILLEGHVLARYIRLQAVIPGAKPWSIAEVYLQ